MRRLILFVLMLFTVGATYAQRTITGNITDNKGEALVGVTIVVKSTDPVIAATSDLEGKYSIKLPKDKSVITFSYVGYATQDITVGASNVVDVKMADDGVMLEQQVVTAQGISRSERSLGYSATKLGGDKVAGSGESNAIQGMAAKVSGVQIYGSAGTPGASSKIIIRGNSTFTGENQPLIVIDGIPYDNSTNTAYGKDYPFNANLTGVSNSNRALDINPDDIENMTVLKGPAASALYGSRAAAGAIVITTKKGKARAHGLNVSFSSSVSMDVVSQLPKTQSIYGQGTGGGTMDSLGNPIAAGVSSNATNQSWGGKIAPGGAYNNNDKFFQTGVTYNNNLSFSGGNEFATFRASYGNTNQKGMIPNTFMNRNTMRINASAGTDLLRVTADASYTHTSDQKAQNGSNLSGLMLGLFRMPADFNILGGDGPNGYDRADGSGWKYWNSYDNPLWSVYNNPNTSTVNRITGTVSLVSKPCKWAEIVYRLGADNYTDFRKQIYAIGAREGSHTGEVWEQALGHTEINSDLLVTVRKDFTEKLKTSLTVGNNLNHRRDNSNFSRGRNLAIPGFYNLGNASDLYADQNTTFKRIAGLFANLDASWDELVYVSLSLRNDWASTFGEDLRNSGFLYYSTSGSFVFSKLLPESSRNILDFGKIRASYALSGKEPSPYLTQTYFTKPLLADGWTDGLGFPYLGQNGYGNSAVLGNKGLKPELQRGYELGTNLRFFKGGRVNLDFTYYNQTVSQILVSRPIAMSTGYQQYISNSGKMRNSGIEIELSADIVKSKAFNWTLGANFSMNKNEVLALADGVNAIEPEVTFGDPSAFAIVGSPYGALFGSRWMRSPSGQIVCDAQGYPIIDPTNGQIGNPYPTYTMGIRNSFKFMGFSVEALLDVRQGNQIWGGTLARLNLFGRSEESAARGQNYVVDGVHQTGTDANGNAIYAKNTTPISAIDYFQYVRGDAGAAENAIYNASWVRLRELTVSYEIPWKNKYIQNISIYFTGRNLVLLTPYKGVDPETSLTGAGSNVGGFDWFNNPGSRSYIFGLRANF